jgi:hypothetical protein
MTAFVNDDSCEVCKKNVTIDGDNNICEKCGNTIINIDNGCRIYSEGLCRSSGDCESSCSDNTCRTTEGQEETKGKIIEKCCELLEKCCSVFGSLEHLIGVILGLIGLG